MRCKGSSSGLSCAGGPSLLRGRSSALGFCIGNCQKWSRSCVMARRRVAEAVISRKFAVKPQVAFPPSCETVIRRAISAVLDHFWTIFLKSCGFLTTPLHLPAPTPAPMLALMTAAAYFPRSAMSRLISCSSMPTMASPRSSDKCAMSSASR